MLRSRLTVASSNCSQLASQAQLLGDRAQLLGDSSSGSEGSGVAAVRATSANKDVSIVGAAVATASLTGILL